MDHFTELLEINRISIERFVRFRLPTKEDADDVLQEIYLAAYQKFGQLKKENAPKAWILQIARNKCKDYFRRKAIEFEIPLESITDTELSDSRYGIAEISLARESLDGLEDKDKEILFLYYWKEWPQYEIAKKLNIPLGTVKSRLYTARQNFKKMYPYHEMERKGETNMKKLPDLLPSYTIEESDKTPFAVKWEELMGWFLIPKLGEKLKWGIYECPSRKCTQTFDMQVTGKAIVHGIEGVELTAKEKYLTGKKEEINRIFVAQLTETHCRYLATLRYDGDIKNYITFLDEDAFMPNWGFGEDNCGNETNLSVKGDIKRSGNNITSLKKKFLLDIVGRYTVTINGKKYDTVCVMDIETYDNGVVGEQFLDANGRTILWRRFNRNDWAIDRYKKKWSEMLPENQQIFVNGETYVHWYDCITDYIL